MSASMQEGARGCHVCKHAKGCLNGYVHAMKQQAECIYINATYICAIDATRGIYMMREGLNAYM